MFSYKYLLLILMVHQSVLSMDSHKKGSRDNQKPVQEKSGQHNQNGSQLYKKVQAQSKRIDNLTEQCAQITASEQQLRADHNALLSAHATLQNKTAQMVQRVKEVEQQENSFKYASVGEAAEQGHLASLMILHQNGKSLEKEGKKKYRPLQWAALMGHPDIIRYLLDHGADVNEQGSRGKTPVYLSTRFDHPKAREATQLLLDRGADLNQSNQQGRYSTALTRCMARGRIGHGTIVINNSSIMDAVQLLCRVPAERKANSPFVTRDIALVDQLLQKDPRILDSSVLLEALAAKDPAWIATLLGRGFTIDAPSLIAHCRKYNHNCCEMLAPFAGNQEVVTYYNDLVVAAVKKRDFKKLIELIGQGSPFGPEIFHKIFFERDMSGVKSVSDQHLFGLLFDILGVDCPYLTHKKGILTNPQARFWQSAHKELSKALRTQNCPQYSRDRYKSYKQTHHLKGI